MNEEKREFTGSCDKHNNKIYTGDTIKTLEGTIGGRKYSQKSIVFKHYNQYIYCDIRDENRYTCLFLDGKKQEQIEIISDKKDG